MHTNKGKTHIINNMYYTYIQTVNTHRDKTKRQLSGLFHLHMKAMDENTDKNRHVYKQDETARHNKRPAQGAIGQTAFTPRPVATAENHDQENALLGQQHVALRSGLFIYLFIY